MRLNDGGGGGTPPWFGAMNGQGLKPPLRLLVAGSAVIATAAAVLLFFKLKWGRKSRTAVRAINPAPAIDEEAQPFLPPGTLRSDAAAVVGPEGATAGPTEETLARINELNQELGRIGATPRARTAAERSDDVRRKKPGSTGAAEEAGETSSWKQRKQSKKEPTSAGNEGKEEDKKDSKNEGGGKGGASGR